MEKIGVAVLGMGWMGETHAQSYLAAARYDDWPAAAELVVCADEDAARAEYARKKYGFAESATDWKKALQNPRVQAVSITAPTLLHAEMVCAAAEAGKHIYCEKPAGRNLKETARAEEAARKAGVISAVGYNYRHLPMVRYCRQLLDEGALGKVEQFNGRFLTMYGGDPLSRLTWRFINAQAGSGAVGDILSHAADMAHYLVGGVRRVSAARKTFITHRPLPQPGGTHFALGKPTDPKGEVENEDYVAALAEFENGATGTLEASRVARGPKCEMAFEIYGEKGSARWNFEKMNELELYLPDGHAAREGYVRLLAGGAHPGHARVNPGDGIGLGYADSKTAEAAQFLHDIAQGAQAQSGMAQALMAAQAADAVLRSCESEKWEALQ